MVKIIGVRFRHAGKIYYFDPDVFEMTAGNHVIVETARGIECGRVVMPPQEVEDADVTQPLRKVIRVATPLDEEKRLENARQAREAFAVCKKKIREHNLDMKLIDAEYTFDHKKLVFYFTADGRVDFRGLIKDLASVFKTRIELRQIGVRDETKMLGGIGICGRPVCCSTYLTDFVPVSIKMAKEQNLSLNPTKISGACGRLMCCLKNEQETYEYLNKQLPNIGDIVENEEGLTGEVQTVNILKQTVRVLIETEEETTVEEMPASGIQIIERHKKGMRRRKERDARAEQEQRAAAAREQARERAAERKLRRAGRQERTARDEQEQQERTERDAAVRTDRQEQPERTARKDAAGRSGKQDGQKRSRQDRQDTAGQQRGNGNNSAARSTAEGQAEGGTKTSEKRRRRRHRRKPAAKTQTEA